MQCHSFQMNVLNVQLHIPVITIPAVKLSIGNSFKQFYKDSNLLQTQGLCTSQRNNSNGAIAKTSEL